MFLRISQLTRWISTFGTLFLLSGGVAPVSGATSLRGLAARSLQQPVISVMESQTEVAASRSLEAAISDLQAFLESECDRGEKDIVIPPGTYRVTPQRRWHLRFVGSKWNDVTIHAEGVEMICTETTRAITIDKVSNFKIIGLTIDYDPLPFTQGKIISMADSNTKHTIELFDGYPTADQVQGDKYEIFKPDTRTLRFGSYHGTTFRVLDSKHIEVTRNGSYKGEQVGDIIAIMTQYAPGGSMPHAIYAFGTSNLILEDVTLYSANMFGFYENSCSGSQYIRCTVDRRPLETDFVARADARIRSLNADAYHSKLGIGPKYEECTAFFMGDDAVAINGDYEMVMKAEGSTLHVLAHRGTLSLEVGDPLEIVSYTGERLADANVVSVVQSADTLSQEDLDFLYAQKMNQRKKDTMRTMYIVQIDKPISMPRGSLVAAANKTGNYFNVTGGHFGYNRSRGILVKGSHGVISHNTIEGSVMQAIKLAPEYWWLSAGSGNDVQIVGNNIKSCGGVGIEISAKAGSGSIAPAGAHNDITIADNIICGVDEEPILVTSTKGLVLENNCMDSEPMLEKTTVSSQTATLPCSAATTVPPTTSIPATTTTTATTLPTTTTTTPATTSTTTTSSTTLPTTTTTTPATTSTTTTSSTTLPTTTLPTTTMATTTSTTTTTTTTSTSTLPTTTTSTTTIPKTEMKLTLDGVSYQCLCHTNESDPDFDAKITLDGTINLCNCEAQVI